jgi:outer membrane receptor for ferrienterochelin and colicins
MAGLVRWVLTALVVIVVGGSAQAGMISGQVTDSTSGEPVAFVSVQIDGTSMGAVADSTGGFVIRRVRSGEHVLVVSAVGYLPRKMTVEVGPPRRAELAIALQATQLESAGIVVSGTRTPRFVKDAPVFTEVISKASIEAKSAHNIFDALEGESGVRVEQQCQGCNFAVLRMQGLGADHTQVLLDGQPVYSGLAAVCGLQQMSTTDIDRIEIVKGAGSALYGSNAVAGAINVVSAVPRQTEAKFGVEAGEYGTNAYSLSASTRKDNVGLFLFAQQTEQDELDATGDMNAPDGVDEPDGWLDRVRSTARSAGFSLHVDDLVSTDRLILRGRAMSETRLGGWLEDNLFENPFAEGSERVITDRYTAQAEYSLWMSGGIQINTSVALVGHKRDATNDTFLGDYQEVHGTDPPVELLRPYTADEDLLSFNVNVVQPIGCKHSLLMGGQVSHNRLEESGMYVDIDSGDPYTSTSHKKGTDVGLYLQDEFKATSRLEIVGGLRFDYHTSEDEFRGSGDVLPGGLEPLEYDESTVNPRVSIKYAASDQLVFRGSIGSGFRVPYGFSEDLHLCSGSPRVYKGGGLKPEKSLSYSLSADYTLSRVTASVNCYRTELRDAIAFSDADEAVADMGYTYQWRNVDDAYVMGAEVNGSVAVSSGLTLGVRLDLFEGKYDSPREDWAGTPYESVSRHISRYPGVSAGMKADWRASGWHLVVDADYKGKMYIDLLEPAEESDVKIHETESFVTVDARLSRKIMERYKVYVGARNLTDYTQKEKHIEDAAFMYAPVYGRIIYGGFQVSL